VTDDGGDSTVPSRVVIIGNSGSGKSYLAQRIAAFDSRLVVSLDELFWVPGGFDQKRPPDEVQTKIDQSLGAQSWVVEGVFGNLASAFLTQANLLIWLDLDWEVCRAGLLERSSQSAERLDPSVATHAIEELVQWASQYSERTTASSRTGHARLVADFAGETLTLTNRSQVEAFIRRRLPAR
jgi:adenylate kinase family enzyme